MNDHVAVTLVMTWNLYQASNGTVEGTISDSRDPLGSMQRITYADRSTACARIGVCEPGREVVLHGTRVVTVNDWQTIPRYEPWKDAR